LGQSYFHVKQNTSSSTTTTYPPISDSTTKKRTIIIIMYSTPTDIRARQHTRSRGASLMLGGPQIFAYLFCNPSSGGNKAGALLKFPQRFSLTNAAGSNVEVTIFNMKDNDSRRLGFEALHGQYQKTPEQILAIAAGGDGTVKWVIGELLKINALGAGLSVIPFGTGNDFSNVHGWGKTEPDGIMTNFSVFSELISEMTMSERVDVDVWRVQLETDPLEGKFEIVQNGTIVERPDGLKTIVETCMNYTSFGQDARAVFHFERHRRKTQLLNKTQYAAEGGLLSMPGKARYLPFKQILVAEPHTVDLTSKFHRHNQGLVFSNIPSYAGGVDFWGRPKQRDTGRYVPQDPGDGILELLTLKQIFDIALNRVGAGEGMKRFAQGSKFSIVFGDSQFPIYGQIDGEGFRMHHPKRCEIKLAYKVKAMTRSNTRSYLIIQANLRGETLIKANWLWIKGGESIRHSWVQRFVVMEISQEGPVIRWYKEGDKEPAGQFDLLRGLQSLEVMKEDNHNLRPYCTLRLVAKENNQLLENAPGAQFGSCLGGSSKGIILLSCKDETECKNWMKAISENSPAMSS
jgi:hypothetical protein